MKTNSPSPALTHNQYSARIIAWGLLLILFLGAVARSHGQSAPKATVNPAGDYKLVSVDGKTVPCTINHDGTSMIVQSGSFTISTNGQITSVMTVSVGDRKDMRCETHATYTLKGAELTMKWQNAGMTQGRVEGQTFTMTNESMVLAYKK
jgi:hypothetical protein